MEECQKCENVLRDDGTCWWCEVFLCGGCKEELEGCWRKVSCYMCGKVLCFGCTPRRHENEDVCPVCEADVLAKRRELEEYRAYRAAMLESIGIGPDEDPKPDLTPEEYEAMGQRHLFAI